MSTLRVELEVRDYDMWRNAFGQDSGGREQNGARRYRIFRAVDNERKVMLDVDFDTPEDAGRFLAIMERDVWPSPDKAPAKVGAPRTHILEMVETEEYG
jgi:hypothetical protein